MLLSNCRGREWCFIGNLAIQADIIWRGIAMWRTNFRKTETVRVMFIYCWFFINVKEVLLEV